MKHLYDAARSDTWRPGPAPDNQAIPMTLTLSSHTGKIQLALDRAAKKTFVQAAKPLRRLLRNQGAVNDSLVEALVHLFSLTQEMINEISELQRRISVLEQSAQPSPAGNLETTKAPPGSVAE